MRLLFPHRPAALLPVALLVLLAALFLPTPTTCQNPLYLVCKNTDSALCTSSSLESKEAIETMREFYRAKTNILCGLSDLKRTLSNRIFIAVKLLSDETKTFYCTNIKDKLRLALRTRRQTDYRLRGRYRGQTQSQYLSVERGNGKDEGKAEAHSAADSSRAIVSGNSGMGQAQSQTIYDPSCEECLGRTDHENEIRGSNQPGYPTQQTGHPNGAIQSPPNQSLSPENIISHPGTLGYPNRGSLLGQANGGVSPNQGLNLPSQQNNNLGLGVRQPQNGMLPGQRGSGIYPGQGTLQPGQAGLQPGQNGSPGQSGPQLEQRIHPGQGVYQPGQLGMHPGQGGAQPGQVSGSAMQPGQGGLLPGHVGSLPGQGVHPGQGGILPGQRGNLPGQGGILSGQVVQPGQGGISPGQGGLQPGQGGILPGQQGNLPGQGGIIPGQGGVQPVQGGILPGQGLHPGQVGISPAQGGVQPGRGGILPGQGGLLPGQGLHSGQGGISPAQGGVPPGQGGILPGHQGNLPGQGGISPGQAGVQPGQGGIYPRQGVLSPGHGGVQPVQGGILPGQGGNLPGQAGIPGQGGVMPGQGGFIPGQGVVQPGQGGIIPGQGNIHPGQGGYNPGLVGLQSGQNGVEPGQGRNQGGFDWPLLSEVLRAKGVVCCFVGPDSQNALGSVSNLLNKQPGQNGYLLPNSGQGVPSPYNSYGMNNIPNTGQGNIQYPYGGIASTGLLPSGSYGASPAGQYGGVGQNVAPAMSPTGQYGGVGQNGLSPTGQYGGVGQNGVSPSGQYGGVGPNGASSTGQYGGIGQISAPSNGQYGGTGYGVSPNGHNEAPTGQFGGVRQNGASPTGQYGGAGQNGASPTGQYGGVGQIVASPTGQYGGVGQNGATPIGQYGGVAQNGPSPTGQYGGVAHNGASPVAQHGGVGQNGVLPIGQYGIVGQNGASPTGQYGGVGQNGASPPGQYGGVGQNGASPTGQYGGGGQNGASPTGQYGGAVQNGQYLPYGSGQNGQVHGGQGQTEQIPQGSQGSTGNGLSPTGQFGGVGQNGPSPTGSHSGGNQIGQSPTGSYPAINNNGQTSTGQIPTGQNGPTVPYNGPGQNLQQPNSLFSNTNQNSLQYPSGQYGGSVPNNIQVGTTAPNEFSGAPQNVVDPNSISSTLDDYDSEAQASVSQATNGTIALASSKGGNEKGRAQTQVEGTYTGTGSFSANAEISDDNKAAQSHVSGSKKGASGSAEGRGRKNKSQASVKLGSETGSILTDSQSGGDMHSSSSQVQGSVKGGMADAQAKGPGSTSSQAQIGFTPYKEQDKNKHDLLKTPFEGGGTASAQSSGRMGTSQSQLRGTFKYGISYNGAAQSGSSIDKDAVFSNLLPFDKIDVYDENNKNININSTEKPADDKVTWTEFYEESTTEVNDKDYAEIPHNQEELSPDHDHSEHHKLDQLNNTETLPPAVMPPISISTSASPPVGNRRSFQNNYNGNTSLNGADYEYPVDKDIPEEYDIDDSFETEAVDNTPVEQNEYPNYDETNRATETHQPLQNTNKKSYEIRQTTGGNTQHIILGSLKNHDAKIVQKNSEHPDEKRVYQPGERVPGMGGYIIPAGFTGSVKSVASKERTYVVGSKYSPSQAQTVNLSPGSGKVKYVYPSNYGQNVNPRDLKSFPNSKPDHNRYVSVSKSVTRDLDSENNIRKQYSHTYYTKSSSCGYFTFTCTMVSSSEGKKKVCKPKIPTNPDGTPMRC